ncbi:transcription elongation factor GreB [Bdellovibrio bacteriovorus]|uniref:Transcription elongation factor GreB n=1 Tax=Bdellovibrio bacteriovorus TaxID=959 RepID=A0A162FXJ7_BDEBC|nr:transcription elongation factor GreB [Bdellovibrio bacteriovorus]KYG62709.1 transcription elongation factor GreB [Bdellovibrio bacteriovorus]
MNQKTGWRVSIEWSRVLPMDNNKNYITPQGLAKLKAEYHELMHVERPKLVEVVAWAASNGDRSENADYQYGKRRLREIDKRVHFLTKRIEDAEVVDPKAMKGTTVLFSATVTLADEEGEEVVYQIVGEDEFDPKNGKISWKSPVAKALLGKKVGDEVRIVKPAGEEYVTIESVEYK